MKLIDTLERLFPEEGMSRAVVTRAGINDGLVAFSARSVENWTNIVHESINQNALKNLVDAAAELQPNVPELGRSYDDYMRWAAANPVTPQVQTMLAQQKPPGFFERMRLVILAWFGVAVGCFAAVGIVARESANHLFDLPNSHVAAAFTAPGESAEAGLRFLGRTVVVIAYYVAYNPVSAVVTLIIGAAVLYGMVKRPAYIARVYAIPMAVVGVVAFGSIAKIMMYDMPIFAFRGALTKLSIQTATFEPPPLLAARADSVWNAIVCSRIANYPKAAALCTARNPLTYTKHLYSTYFHNVLFTVALCALGIAVLRRLSLPSADKSWNLPRTWKRSLIAVTACMTLAALLCVPWTFARTVASMNFPYICDGGECSFRICLDSATCYSFYPADAEIEEAGPIPPKARISTRDMLQTAFAEQLAALDVKPPERAQRLGGDQ